MSITRFEFEDLDRGWRLEPVTFDTINLLVGISGVGKSRILSALMMVSRAAQRELSGGVHARWRIVVRCDEDEFVWEVLATPRQGQTKTAVVKGGRRDVLEGKASSFFVSERVMTSDGHVIAERDEQGVRVGELSIALKESESIVSLLRGNRGIYPVFWGLGRVFFSYSSSLMMLPEYERQRLENWGAQLNSLDDLRADESTSFLEKVWILERFFPSEFGLVQRQYAEVFTGVQQLTVEPLSELDARASRERNNDYLHLAFREDGVDGWVPSFEMSTGMYRTLIHLLELTLLPPGSVILIDEYENSMGVNCLPEVTELLLRRAGEIQLILTSHHPYVINNIPKRWWKVVQREGGVVRVTPASSIRRLNTASQQEAFIQLLGATEYAEGIA